MPQNQVYFGAMMQGADPPWAATFNAGGSFNTFEARTGKPVAIASFGNSFYSGATPQAFETGAYNGARGHGSIPMVDFGAWDRANGTGVQPLFTNAAIIAGNYDTYINTWANAAKTWGHPFFLRYNNEMNAWWYPWGEGKPGGASIINGNAVGSFNAAWIHVHNIFTTVGVPNATWIWCPNYYTSPLGNYAPLSQVYPGDAYVDWLGVTVYNKGGGWSSLTNRLTGVGGGGFANSYADVCAINSTKPIFIGEISCVEGGDDGTMKATWISNMLNTELQQNFPRIRAFAWYNWQDSVPPPYTFPIETTAKSQQAFHDGIQLSYYTSNIYGNISQNPILAPFSNDLYNSVIAGTAGLVNYWPLDDAAASATARDQGGALPLTNLAGVTEGGAGLVVDPVTAYSYSGVTATSKSTSAATVLPTAWTIELWVKRSRLLTQEFLISHGPTVAAADQILGIGFDGLNALFCGFISDDFSTGATLANDTTKAHHFVATYDSATKLQQIFWDGKFIQSRTSTGVYGNQSTPFQIGQRLNSANQAPFVGSLAQVALYNVVLPLSTISQHYRVGAGIAANVPLHLAMSMERGETIGELVV